MRPIKFRIWDNVLKQMIFHSPSMVIRLSGSVTDGSTVANVELMQFTGLHDKDGKEIYEGDIVTCPQFPRPLFVKWDNNGYFLFENICNEASLGGDNDCVIGNIFENANLLKDGPQPQAMSRDKAGGSARERGTDGRDNTE